MDKAKILIVEDEPPIARALERCIEQLGNDFFQVVGKVINGRQALEQLEKNEVDIVFTDIRMPVMDGLELIEEIHTRYPDVISVVLSGYQNFSYAQTALRYGVVDYLLKPISMQEVEKLLGKLKTLFESKAIKRKHNELMHVLKGERTPNKAAESNCVVILICAGAFPTVTDDILLSGNAFWEKCNLEKILTEMLAGSGDCFIFDGKAAVEKRVIIEQNEPSVELTQKLFEKLNSQSDLSITIVSHKGKIPITMVNDTIRMLRSCLYKEIKICSPSLIWCDKEAKNSKNIPVDTTICNNIVENICINNEEKLMESVEQIFKQNQDEITQAQFSQLMDIVISDSRLLINSSQIDPDIRMRLNDAISNSTNIQDLCRDITSVLLSLGESAAQKGKRETNEVVEQIEQYLIVNYNKSISNELLSKKFGFVPSYLSKLFRTVKGMSPSEYLAHYRIERAMELITEQPDLKIYDVAKAIGMNDQYYFSKLFKKQTGLWPKEFAKSCIKPSE